MNKKTLFLIITLTAMLILVTSVNAATDNTNTSTTHSISEKTTTAEPVVKEKIEKSATKEITTKEINKKNKTKEKKKTDSITIDGIEYDNIFENQVFDDEYLEIGEENTLYNNCIFSNPDGFIYIFNSYDFINKKMIVNHVVFNNSIINSYIYSDAYLHIYNSTLNSTISNYGYYISIDDSSTIGENFYIESGSYGMIISNNSLVNENLKEIGIYSGENSLENMIIKNVITNLGNLTIKNCTLNSTIYNEGILIIDDNTIIGNNFALDTITTYLKDLDMENREIIINDTTRIGIFEGEIYDKNINLHITTNNVTFINCNITAPITNKGNLVRQAIVFSS